MTARFPWKIAGGLAATALLVGLWAGWNFATMSETDVINAAALHYIENGPETARAEHCVARPGTPPVWISVICAPPGKTATIYQADRLGRLSLVAVADPEDATQL